MVQYLEIKSSVSNISKINKSIKSNRCNIIAIYMEGCIHCQMLHPEWKKAAKKLAKVSNNNGIVSFVNMKYMNQLNINTSDIYGFPHIVAIKNGKQITYTGSRDNASLFTWMSSMCPSKNVTKKKKSKNNKTKRKRRRGKKQTKRKN